VPPLLGLCSRRNHRKLGPVGVARGRDYDDWAGACQSVSSPFPLKLQQRPRGPAPVDRRSLL
jgi:hypothetical protein